MDSKINFFEEFVEARGQGSGLVFDIIKYINVFYNINQHPMSPFREHPYIEHSTINWMYSTFFLFLLIVQTPSFSQTSSNLERADELYQQHSYNAALELYNNTESSLATMERMANSYRLNHDTENAEKWYARIVEETNEPLNYLHYAHALQSNGNLDLAKEFYLKYDKAIASNLDNRGSDMAATMGRLTMTAGGEILVKNASIINSDKLDFSPAFYNNGIVFASTRTSENPLANNKDNWTGDSFSNLYFTDYQANGKLSEPVPFSAGLASKHHEGPLAFFPGGKEMLFTRNISHKVKDRKKELFLKITRAVKEGKQWLRAGEIDLGSGNWNDAHPSLSADCKYLYFASDRPGGYGGMDLYVVRYLNGTCSFPVNLGPEINTSGNEVFPFIFADGTLYFASDGWGGIGGLDIFHSQADVEGFWKQAANIGSPINSNKDDFGYMLDLSGTNGFFTSAREGGAGKDDIYQFTLPTPQSNIVNHLPNTTICLFDETTEKRIAGANISIFSKTDDGSFIGYEKEYMVKLVASTMIGGYEKQLIEPDPFGYGEVTSGIYETDKNGQTDLYLDHSKTYLLVAKVPGYEPTNRQFSPSTKLNCFSLKPVNCINLTGKVSNKEHQQFIAGAAVTLINLSTGKQEDTFSDELGNYNFCLERGYDFIVKGSKANFIVENGLVSTINTDGTNGFVNRDLQLTPATDNFLASSATSSNLFAEGVLIELENIYYDYGQSDIRPDAAKELDLVAQFLSRHATLLVELRSHTDSRGDDDFNRTLSLKRAKTTVAYLVQKGINKSRLTAIGLGEDQLLNDCDDGIECPDAAHQINRRTEMKLMEK